MSPICVMKGVGRLVEKRERCSVFHSSSGTIRTLGTPILFLSQTASTSMPFAKSLASSRSFVELSLLNCASSSAADPDLEPDSMKDLRSFTGVRTPYKNLTTSPDGTQLIFKKDNNKLYWYNVEDVTQCANITVRGIDVCHNDDTIFEIAFLTEHNVVVVLQDGENNLYIFKGILDVNQKVLNVVSPVTSTRIASRKHCSVALIYDETGPVLISYPMSFGRHVQQDSADAEGPSIQLLHLLDFYTKSGIHTTSLHPRVKDDRALFCDPFIFRNRLYLFNRFGTNLLCVAIAGSDRGEVRILNTYPDGKGGRPNNRYANRCLLLRDEILLVYFHQRLDNPDEEPQLWKLELGPMKWHRLQLLLNHHLPTSRVCLRQAAFEPIAFLHGECGRSSCQEKAHLYQISLLQDCVKPKSSSSTNVSQIANQNTRKQCNQLKEADTKSTSSSSSTNSPAVNTNADSRVTEVTESDDLLKSSVSSVEVDGANPSTSSVCGSSSQSNSASHNPTTVQPPAIRYANRKGLRDKKKRSSSVSACVKFSTASTTDAMEEQKMHWSEEMANEGGALTISEQLKLAKDMGYTDEEIMQAVNLNCARDGSYRPFPSTNAMIDMLSRVQRMCETTSPYNNSMITSADSGLELDKSGVHPTLTPTQHHNTAPNFSCFSRVSPPLTPTTAGVRRATSFHSTSPSRSNYDDPMSVSIHEMRYRLSPSQFQLQRLLDAFEKEQKSYGDESKRSIQMLEEKCKQFADKQAILQARLVEKDAEIQSLKAQLHDQITLKEQLRRTETKLDIQILENKSKADQIRVLTEQAEVVKKQHTSEVQQKEEIISELITKLSSIEEANKPLAEENAKLQSEIDELKKQLAKKQADLDKCSNYHAEILKAEQRIEEIRLERDEVRSTLSKVPTCVICLDKRPQMLYMPCSHFICCEGCGNRFDHCPTCRQKICGKITVYQ
uniref:RING-type domain-containing protein n=1 Tax=Parascaris univalens TaxID=6257 RepID=A0A915AGL0_PARUN